VTFRRAAAALTLPWIVAACGPASPEPASPAKTTTAAAPDAGRPAAACPASVADAEKAMERAEALEGATVDKVCFLGAGSAEAALAGLLATKEGRPLAQAEVAKDVQAIHRTNRVEDVAVFAVPGEGKSAVVVFQVAVRPLVAVIAFEGTDDPSATRAFPIKQGEPWNPAAARAGCRTIEDQLRLHGHIKARCAASLLAPSNRAVVRVEPGATYKVSKIALAGAKQVKEAELLKISGVAPGDVFSAENLQRGVFMMTSLYHDRGLVTAKLALDVKEDGREGMAVSVQIDEGVVFRVKGVRVTGDLGGSKEADLVKAMATKPGAVFNRSQMLRDIEKLTADEKAKGHAIEIVPDVALDDKAHVVDVNLRLEKR
jgi:outer membrane protein assembly factor BamA